MSRGSRRFTVRLDTNYDLALLSIQRYKAMNRADSIRFSINAGLREIQNLIDGQLRGAKKEMKSRFYTTLKIPDSWYTYQAVSADAFIQGMLSLGKPLEISLVGVFECRDFPGRGSRRDMDLPLHQDGIYSKSLADAQGGHYVEQSGISIVGLYCISSGAKPCYTTLSYDGENVIEELNLYTGQALIFDNKRLWHGRKGLVGDRILIRMWVSTD